MCGRYTLTVTIDDLHALLPGFEIRAEPVPRYNVAPTQLMPVAFNDERAVTPARWGLIPSWAKDAAIGSRMINARAETLAEKPSFRDCFKKRRCLVPATGFYEWRKEEGKTRKTPFLIRAPEGQPFTFAGLWDAWRSPEGVIRSFTIITTSPNERVAPIHDRMPIIVPASDRESWLSADAREPSELASLLTPYAGELEILEVSTMVNSPANESPDCLQAAP